MIHDGSIDKIWNEKNKKLKLICVSEIWNVKLQVSQIRIAMNYIWNCNCAKYRTRLSISVIENCKHPKYGFALSISGSVILRNIDKH